MPRSIIRDITPLHECELFQGLTDEEVSKFIPLCADFAVIEGGVVIFNEGRDASHLYLVVEGQIALQKAIRAPHARGSRRTVVAVCRPGEVVGWSALVEPYRYTLSAAAWNSSRLIRVDSKLLRKALDTYPVIGYKVMGALSAIMSRRLRQTTETLINQREMSYSGV